MAVHAGVRAALLDLQRSFAAQPGGAVLDGRDIGTVVCPDAHVKLYIDADIAERARRRADELRRRGEPVSDEQMLAELRERDARDSGRATAPLRQAGDAHLIDTTSLSIDAVLKAARRIIDPVMADFGRYRAGGSTGGPKS